MNRNDKNKKFTPLNINNVFKGKSIDTQNKTSYRIGGMQNIGKVSSNRRVLAPKWTPSIKAESGVTENKIINQTSSGWINPTTQDGNDQNLMRNQSLINKDKNQWTSKNLSNKPFFLMGQEFPSLQSDTGQDVNLELNKDNNKFKEADSVKSKLEELRNRDNSISVSTLNRIDALSISKSTKGDIAATGWAAEDEEPNFDEKIVFSDEESLNEVQNWHSDLEEVQSNKMDSVRISQHEPHDQHHQLHQLHLQHQQSQQPPHFSMGDTWDIVQPPQYPQFQQFQMQMNIATSHPFLANAAKFSQQGVMPRSSAPVGNQGVINEEPSAFQTSVADQRNARNLEYAIAIERARQKKMGVSGSGAPVRGYGPYNEDPSHSDQGIGRSRHTSMTSDKADCTNMPMSLVEMGPPGGPPLMHGHMHKPHVPPMMHQGPTQTSTRFTHTQPPQQPMQFFMPTQTVSLEQITDPKLMEKWLEFLKQQSSSTMAEGNHEMTVAMGRGSHDSDTGRSLNESQRSYKDESERQTSIRSPLSHSSQSQIKERVDLASDNISVPDTGHTSQKDNTQNTKNLYSTDEEGQKTDSCKRYPRQKYGSSKEYRSSKHNGKGEYGGNVNQEYGESYRGEDDVAYEDYHVYQQHYPPERHRDYKNMQDYRRGQHSYQYYDDTYVRDPNDYSYRSGSLKYKSTKVKDNTKLPVGQMDGSQSYRGHSSLTKKSVGNNQDYQYNDRDNFEGSDRKSSKDSRRGIKSDISSHQSKRDDSRPYKDRPSEPPRQEFSMGFAVNPKESRRSNYYPSSYNRRYYNTDYQYYGNYPPANNGSNCQPYSGDYNDSYYQEDHYPYRPYDQDSGYVPSFSRSTKRSPKQGLPSTSSEQWHSTKSDKSKSDIVSTKTNNRNYRIKSDKRQSSMTKESSNDNDLEEWATASEGGSERSASAPRDGSKSSSIRHHATSETTTTDQKLDEEESDKIEQSSPSGTRRATENRFGSSNSCNGTWPSYQDEDGNDGASGAAGGSRSAGARSIISQNKSTDSSQAQNTDNKAGSNDSSSKDNSNNNNNNNNSHRESQKSVERQNRSFADFIDTNRSSSVINVDKLPEVTEDEELLYENVEQFKEVLSKATKKNRKIEEQRRLKEELELKRLETLRLKNKNDSKIIKKPLYKKEPLKIDKPDNHVNRKIETKTAPIARDKDPMIGSNNFKKFDCNKVSMTIGSWDNSLADDIDSDKKVPLKPIGTPASTISWNAKVKPIPKCNTVAISNPTASRIPPEMSNENNTTQLDMKISPSTKNVYLVSSESQESNFNSSISYSYKNTIFDRPNEEKQIKDQLEPKSTDMTLTGSITFDYDVSNMNCDNKPKRGSLVPDRNLPKNDQQSLNEKINLVKTIWDNQHINVTSADNDIIRPSVTVSVDLDSHTTTSSIMQDTIVTRNIDVPTTLSITNVCKVKPQLQQDFIKKDPIEPLLSSGFTIRNSPATFLAQNQGNFMPFTHRFPPDILQDHLHASDALASLFTTNQPNVHLNYNLPNHHRLLDSSLLRQNAQDHILTNKVNFISQQSFYPQAAVTPKLFSNATGQLPLNMDISSSHGALPLQQLLLSRQNSLTSMMQPNGISIPFLQSGQQHTQAPLFPATPILGPTNFNNPFSQSHLPAHYSPGNFPSLHNNPQFPPSHQMLLNHHHHQQQQHQQQQQQQQHHQQIMHSQVSHDRVINPGQSGIYNSIMGSSDISPNTGLPDFNGQTKHLSHSNLMHGINGSAIMLPHNLNILMKPHLFATSSQYNSLQAPIQSNYQSIRNNYENHSNLKLATELDIYKSSENNIDRNIYNIDNYMGLPKQREEFYIDQNEYDNCDINPEPNWANSFRQNNANNFLQTLDFQSQRSPIQLPVIDPTMAYNDPVSYRYPINNFRGAGSSGDHYQTMPSNVHHNSNYGLSVNHRTSKQQPFHQDQTCNIVKQTSRNYNSAATFPGNDHSYTNKNDNIDNKNISSPATCDPNMTSEPSDNFGKDLVNSEKSFTTKTKASKQRSSYSDNFDDKNPSWSIVDDDGMEMMKLKSNSNLDTINHDLVSGHNAGKQYNGPGLSCSVFDNQCQYGYDETRLSSQTAESLGKFDSDQMKKMIMKLREGPVMTFADFDGFDSQGLARKTKVIMPMQSSRNRSLHKSYHSHHGSEFAGMGFYSRNRALTPPPPSSATTSDHLGRLYPRNYKCVSKTSFTRPSNSYRPCHVKSDAVSTSNIVTTTIATSIQDTTTATTTTTTTIKASNDNDETPSDCLYHHHHHPLAITSHQDCDNINTSDSNLIDDIIIIDSAVL